MYCSKTVNYLNAVNENDQIDTSAGKGNDSGYFQLLASGPHPLHIQPR